MNNTDLRASAPRDGIAQRSDRATNQGRSTALIPVGVSLAIAGAVLTAASAPDHLPSMVLGLGLFIAGAAMGLTSASSLPHSLSEAARPGGGAMSEDSDRGASAARSFYDSVASVQLGPDPEQVIGRQTGART